MLESGSRVFSRPGAYCPAQWRLYKGQQASWGLRFLLGIAEAGFFPGVILYLTYWFPARYRARIIGTFSLAIPISVAVGAPLSTLILQLDGAAGLKGWQWLFLIEGLPALLGTFAVLRMLTDRPEQARWLAEEEKAWLRNELTQDAPAAHGHNVSALRQAFTNPAVLTLAFIGSGANGFAGRDDSYRYGYLID